MSKKSRKLLPFNPIEDPVRRLEQMASLATALTATGTEFSNELTYIAGMAPRSANCAVFERDGMQVFSIPIFSGINIVGLDYLRNTRLRLYRIFNITGQLRRCCVLATPCFYSV